MIKRFYFLLLAVFCVSCGDVTDFAAQLDSADDAAKAIANHLSDYAEIDDCNIQIDGKTAVVSLDLAVKLDDANLISLKKQVAADVKRLNSNITHVAVNTAPNMLEHIQGDSIDAPTNDAEIFVNPIPTI